MWFTELLKLSHNNLQYGLKSVLEFPGCSNRTLVGTASDVGLPQDHCKDSRSAHTPPFYAPTFRERDFQHRRVHARLRGLT
jgi:hypothetical protein